MLPNKKYTPSDFAKIARKRVLLLIVPTVLGLFVGLLVSSGIPDVYQAETLIQIVPQRVPDSYVRSTVTIRTEDRLEALHQQVMSRTQLERMIVEMDLYPGERLRQPMQDVIERMRASAKIELVRQARNQPADAFFLRFEYGNPAIAARVTERLGTLYVEYNARERGALAAGTNDFLEAQLADAKARLDAQEKKLQTFRERHSGRLPSQLQSNMQAIQSTQMQRQGVTESLARDRDRKLMLERLYNDALAEPALIRPQAGAPSDPAASGMTPQQQLAIARSTLARLETRLKEGHPDLRRARKQVADLEKQVDGAAPGEPATSAGTGLTGEELQRRDRISSMRAELESLDRQIAFKESEERRLSGVIADYQGKIDSVPGVESDWLSLSRDYDTLQAAFRELLTKSESAKVAADLENRQIGEQFRVLDAPRVPVRPMRPQRAVFSGGGTAAGLLIGLILVGLLEIRDSTLRTEHDVEQVLKLPVIALVPTLMTVRDKRLARRRRWAVSSMAVIAVFAGGYVAWAMKLWKFVS